MKNKLIIYLFLLLASIQTAYATATVMPVPVARFFNAAGAPLAGGKVYTYAAGTTTPQASYTDSTALTANANPVILDANGQAPIWLSGAYKIVLQDANGVQQWVADNVQDFFTFDNITSTSTTSLAIANSASKTFTTQSSKYFSPGIFVQATETSNTANWMHGQVTSYTGTQLVIETDAVGGSGTIADWTISLSGPIGPKGDTGSSGDGSGDMVGADNLAVGAGGVASAATARTNLGLGSSAVLDVGTSANKVVQLTAAAKLPAVDGSLLTNVVASGSPVVTNSASGKIVMGAVTIQWGNATCSSTVSYGASFSSAPYSVTITQHPGSAQASYAAQVVGTPTSSGFTCYQPNAYNVYWIAIGPT